MVFRRQYGTPFQKICLRYLIGLRGCEFIPHTSISPNDKIDRLSTLQDFLHHRNERIIVLKYIIPSILTSKTYKPM